MSRKCDLSNRTKLSGNKRSHAENATRRSWNLNLQKATIIVDGKKVKVRASVKALKTIKKQNANKQLTVKVKDNHTQPHTELPATLETTN